MKKLLCCIILVALLTAGCSSEPGTADGNSTAADTMDESVVPYGMPGEEIKFYPTYDANYKTASNIIFDFWFDIPNDWKAVDQSEDGTEYTILPGNENIVIKLYGHLKKEPEEDFYKSLSGSKGTVTDFTYRDGWIGKEIKVSDNEVYYARVDGDSYIILHITSKDDNEWMEQNREKLNYVAMSARTTRESYGNGLEDENVITLDDLQLGKITLDMSYDDLLKIMQQKPEKEVEEEYEGLKAKTLFFSDNTQIYVVEDTIYSVNVTSPEYPTPRGLKTGDSIERLKQLYGEPANMEEENRWGYTYNGYELFTVVVKDGKVVEIQIDLGM